MKRLTTAIAASPLGYGDYGVPIMETGDLFDGVLIRKDSCLLLNPTALNPDNLLQAE